MGWLIGAVFVSGLIVAVLRRGRQTALEAAERAFEQLAYVMPQLLIAMLAAGFVAELIPAQWVAGLLGPESGWIGLVVASFAGPLVPAGPVLAFSIAAMFGKAGATPEALVAFITSWSLFTIHRVVTYELPMLGFSFLRLRLLSVGLVPIAAGAIASVILKFVG